METKITNDCKNKQHSCEANLKINDNTFWGEYKTEFNAYGKDDAEAIRNLLSLFNNLTIKLKTELVSIMENAENDK